jgi:hypothetical protein
MKSKPTSFFSFGTFMFFWMLLVLPLTQSAFAQQINPKILNFFQICAGGPHPNKPGEIFNEYQASFSILGFTSDVLFRVELSDSTGSFINPTSTTVLVALPGTPPDTATDRTLTFAVPTNLIGSDTYKLRVVSSTEIASQPFIISGTTSTKIFSVYYKAFSDSFSINNKQSSAGFCNGGSVTLSVDNPTPDITNSSPANYPQLKYNWYKDDVLIPGQTSSSLSNISVAGDYYAALDYGLCSGNYLSQKVKVVGGSSTGMPIISSLGNPFCSSMGNTTLTVASGKTYTWRKDNVVIDGAISQTYQTNLSGVYTCDVDFGGCKGVGTIDLKVLKTNSAISGVDVDKVNRIEEGETLSATITSDAASPSYQWFFNGVVLPGADENFIDISAQGKYKGVVTQNTGCVITDEFLFEVSYKKNYNVQQISNIVSPNNDGANDTWIIPDQYISGTNTKVMILSSSGEIVFKTDNYDNYNGWPQTAIEFNNYNPVYYYIITPTGQSAKKGSITLVK